MFFFARNEAYPNEQIDYDFDHDFELQYPIEIKISLFFMALKFSFIRMLSHFKKRSVAVTPLNLENFLLNFMIENPNNCN